MKINADGWLGIWFFVVIFMLCGTCGFAPNCAPTPDEPSCTCTCKGEMGGAKECDCYCTDVPPGVLNGEG